MGLDQACRRKAGCNGLPRLVVPGSLPRFAISCPELHRFEHHEILDQHFVDVHHW